MADPTPTNDLPKETAQMNLHQTTLADLTGHDVCNARWVRIVASREVGRLVSVTHNPQSTEIVLASADDEGPTRSLLNTDTPVELLIGCELCEKPIVDEEPVWGGEDGDIPLHAGCATSADPGDYDLTNVDGGIAAGGEHDG